MSLIYMKPTSKYIPLLQFLSDFCYETDRMPGAQILGQLNEMLIFEQV